MCVAQPVGARRAAGVQMRHVQQVVVHKRKQLLAKESLIDVPHLPLNLNIAAFVQLAAVRQLLQERHRHARQQLHDRERDGPQLLEADIGECALQQHLELVFVLWQQFEEFALECV